MTAATTSNQVGDDAKREVQVEPAHYDFARYDDRERWMSYWHQINVVLKAKPRTVLEIGPGSGVFRSYLQNAGIVVKTLDLDPSRKPDHVADIAKLDQTLPSGLKFDVVCAFQVLEHLPFSQFEACLRGIAQRASEHVFISLPYRGWRVRFGFWWGERAMTIGHKFKLPWKLKRCDEHYWELNNGVSHRNVTKLLSKHFQVLDQGLIPENPYHYMWQLRTQRQLPGLQ